MPSNVWQSGCCRADGAQSFIGSRAAEPGDVGCRNLRNLKKAGKAREILIGDMLSNHQRYRFAFVGMDEDQFVPVARDRAADVVGDAQEFIERGLPACCAEGVVIRDRDAGFGNLHGAAADKA